MALDITRIKPASLKAKEVATKDYVDSSVGAIDLDWQANVQAVLDSNSTIIDGSKIITGTIDAARLFTNEIVMQTSYSGVIKSANYVDGVSGMKINFKEGSIYIA